MLLRSSRLQPWWLLSAALLVACADGLPVIGAARDAAPSQDITDVSEAGDAPGDATDVADSGDGMTVDADDGATVDAGDVVTTDGGDAMTADGGDVMSTDVDDVTAVDGGDVVSADGGDAVTDGGDAADDVIVIGDSTACATGEALCGGRCISVLDDNANCGACGMACATATTCRGGACVPVCATGEVLCGMPARCVNTQSDAANCGACGNACPAGQVCTMGACMIAPCMAPTTMCTSSAGVTACVNLRTDTANCGACGNACPTGQMCVDGACQLVCPSGQTACGDACIDVLTSLANCGACGRACAAGLACVMGACTCPMGQSLCGGACVDTQTSTAHCGSCDAACTTGRTCTAGRCVVTCTTGQTLCTDACVDTMTDAAHCGTCGNACPSGQLCTAGACACPTGRMLCGGACVDTMTDTANCGRCGTACSAGQTCTSGACRGGGPANDTRATATPIDLRTPAITLTANTSAAAADARGGCGCTMGNDVFYSITLTAPELVYADTFGSSFDAALYFQDAMGVNVAASSIPGGVVCNDNAPCMTTSEARNARVVTRLAAGTWYLVLSGCGAGAATIHFQHLPVGSGTLTQGTTLTGTATLRGTTTGTGLIAPSCVTTPTGPEDTYWTVTCPEFTATPFTASTCGAAMWDTVLDQRSATRSPLSVCNDDSCGFQSLITGTLPAGAGLHTLYIDGYNAAAQGAYTLTIRFGACPTGQTACGATCVNLQTDNANCGACGTACATGLTCVTGRCTCPTGTALCSGACVNLQTSNTNCGACGNACPTGQTCTTGRCVCPTGQTACGTTCVNLQTDSANCGRCGGACPTGQSCATGRCVCPTGTTLCGGACVNTQTDATNCGACGTRCPTGQSCTTGRCTCPTGQTACGATCSTLTADRANCGACGNACASNANCSSSRCSVFNDARTSPIIVPLLATETTVTGTTAGATFDGPTTCNGTTGPNVWYRITLAAREILYVDTAGSAYDTRLYLLDSGGTMVANTCNDDAGCTTGGFTNGFQSRFAVVVNAGTYDIAVGGFDGRSSGAFTMHIQHMPTNQGSNFLATAIAGTATTMSRTLGTGSLFTPSCAAGASGEDVRWFVTCGGTMQSVFSTCPADGATYTRRAGSSNYDPVMVVWSGNTNAQVSCNDDGPSTLNCRGTGGDTMNYGARIQAAVPRGVATVIVDDYGTMSGLTYTLRHQIIP